MWCGDQRITFLWVVRIYFLFGLDIQLFNGGFAAEYRIPPRTSAMSTIVDTLNTQHIEAVRVLMQELTAQLSLCQTPQEEDAARKWHSILLARLEKTHKDQVVLALVNAGPEVTAMK